ncbi:hypothetical protein FRC14_002055 [Serendipita sp. 396]|nr:hypothetical protein FRC14_002055 [Serendipita sp. 396]KAG8876007.1 hypothetical protein FRC20_002571 [Serendipita sp. 405]
MDDLYGHSILATLNSSSSNQVRTQHVRAISPSRKPNRISTRPNANQPSANALPIAPSLTTISPLGSQQSPQGLRVSSQPSLVSGRGHSPTMAHPYSAQSLGSTSDVEHEYSDGGISSSDRSQRPLYRSVAHSENSQQPAVVSQARVGNFDNRQPSTHSITPSSDSNYGHVVYAPRDPSTGISPGSYFAAYPPVTGSGYRGRSDSANSAASAGSSPYPAPLTAPSGSGAPPSNHSASHSRSTRPSSRKALTAALELAKNAVQLDSSNDNPHAAVLAYAKSVRLLGEVMERVMRGEDTASSSTATAGANGHANTPSADAEDRRRGSRRRSVVAKEEEVRRLKAIHDTYADRMKILCLIYSIQDPFAPTPEPGTGPDAGSIPSASENGLPATSEATYQPQSEAQNGLDSMLSLGSSTDQPEDGVIGGGSISELEPGMSTALHEQLGTSNSPFDNAVYRRGAERNGDREQTYDHSNSLTENIAPIPPLAKSSIPFEESGVVSPPMVSSTNPVTSPKSPNSHAILHSMGGRTSVLPPPRPPPSGPLPNRPKLPSGTIVPPQLLNQPLPPLPSAPQPPPEPLQQLFQQTQTTKPAASSVQPSLTRQSSASSVSGVSGVSSTASSSSATSNVYTNPSTGSNLSQTNLSVSGSQPSANASSLAAPFPNRPRGNSNAHGRTLSNAERLLVVNEEKEEEEGTIRGVAQLNPPSNPQAPQEFKYRSRSSSMVSLKDRDRARAQVLGPTDAPPLPTNLPTSPPSVMQVAAIVPLNLKRRTPPPDHQTTESAVASTPNLTTLGPRTVSRNRGNSVGSATTHTSEEYSSSSSTPIATMPYTAGGAPPPSSAPIVVPGAIGAGFDGPVRISANTSTGTISQRRIKNATTGSSVPSPPANAGSVVNKLTSAILPASTATSLGLTGRNRAASNPGKRPGSTSNIHFNGTTEPQTARPPMPPPPMSAGPRRQFANFKYQSFGMPSPGGSTNNSTSSLVPTNAGTPIPGVSIAGVPASSPPLPPPNLSVLRPYYLISLLRRSITDRSGGYVTPRLHIPHEVWTQGSAKLTNIAEKTKVIDLLLTAMDELSTASIEFCGSSSSIAASTGGGKGDKKQGDRWAEKLEDFDRTFIQVGETFGKKLGLGGGFVMRKSIGMAAFGSKLMDRIDKIATSGKSYDSPMTYSNQLSRLFTQIQMLEEHTRALHLSPHPPAYDALQMEARTRVEATLKNISELFAKVVLTFVFRDLGVMLDKYHKTCDRWIQSNPGYPP